MEQYQKLTPVLYVDKIEPCLPFWKEKLGFEQVMEVKEGDELGFVYLHKDGVSIMYQSKASLKKDLPNHADDIGRPTGLLYIYVNDFDDIEKRLEGVKIEVPKRETFYGATEIFVREPAGHLIAFAKQHKP